MADPQRGTGIAARQLYGRLLNNFTESETLPVFRTESQDRMVKSEFCGERAHRRENLLTRVLPSAMLNFVAGFFGIPEYQQEVNIEIMVEAAGYNDTGAPYDLCPNANNARGSVGTKAATEFVQPYLEKAAERLNKCLSGSLSLDASDVNAMIQLCAVSGLPFPFGEFQCYSFASPLQYETQALGYSAFCDLFTEEDFQAFEQYARSVPLCFEERKHWTYSRSRAVRHSVCRQLWLPVTGRRCARQRIPARVYCPAQSHPDLEIRLGDQFNPRRQYDHVPAEPVHLCRRRA